MPSSPASVHRTATCTHSSSPPHISFLSLTHAGATKRIALFDTLIAQTDLPELVAILAHEVGHEKKGHIKQSMGFSICYLFVVLYLMSIFISYEPLFDAFFVSTPSVYVGLLLFQMLFSPVDTFLQVWLRGLDSGSGYASRCCSHLRTFSHRSFCPRVPVQTSLRR